MGEAEVLKEILQFKWMGRADLMEVMFEQWMKGKSELDKYGVVRCPMQREWLGQWGTKIGVCLECLKFWGGFDCQDRMSKKCDGKGPWGQIIFHFVGLYKDSGFYAEMGWKVLF